MTLRLLTLLALAGIATSGVAQTQAPKPQETPAAARPVSARADDGSPSSRDPRVCLEFPTRAQVIACAEKYRPRRGAAKT